MLPYVPVLELLRGYFGVSELDDARVAREKIAGRLLLLDESFKETLPLLFDFMGVPDPARPAPAMEPEQRKHAGIRRSRAHAEAHSAGRACGRCRVGRPPLDRRRERHVPRRHDRDHAADA
jgi:hypothetical protein